MKIKQSLLLSVALPVCLAAGMVSAFAGGGGGGGGGRGGFDPTQIEQFLVDAIREQMEVKDDAEWKVIGDQVRKVFQAQTQSGFGGGLNMARAFRPRGGGAAGGQDNGNAQGGGRRRTTQIGGLGAADPEMEVLQRAIDNNASAAELKAAVARYVEARKKRQENLERAQSDLRKLLTARQEAVAFSLGLL